jgi:hypothetical protein
VKPSPTTSPSFLDQLLAEKRKSLKVKVTGKVFRPDGRPVNGGYINITTVGRDEEWWAMSSISEGLYKAEVANAPEIELTIVSSKYTKIVRRVKADTPEAFEQGIVVNFGGPATAEDPEAPNYAVP